MRSLPTKTAYQRHGIGKELLAPMLAAADAQHVGCFLFTATASNAAWYRRLGFTEETRYRPTPTWPEVWALWRPPR